MASARHKPRTTMSATEFFRWPGDGSGRKLELVDGVVRVVSPAHPTHGIIQANLAMLLAGHLRSKRLPCVAVAEPPVVPRIRAAENVGVPDIGVSCAKVPDAEPHLAEPVLLFEILSPSSQSHTRCNVCAYATIPSVAEIVIVQSSGLEAQVPRRPGDGTWPDSARPIPAEAALELASLTLTSPLRDLYAGTRLTG